MAKNIIHEDGTQLDRVITEPGGTYKPGEAAKSGDPVLCGQKPGVALINELPNGKATVKFTGTAELLVHAQGAGGGSAIAPGDIAYFDAAPGGSNPVINKDATNGVRFGYFTAALASGQTGLQHVDIGY